MVKGGVGEIDVVFLRHAVLGKAQALAEPLEVNDFPLAQELDNVVDVGIVAETEDVVVGNAGLLFCCEVVKTTFCVC